MISIWVTLGAAHRHVSGDRPPHRVVPSGVSRLRLMLRSPNIVMIVPSVTAQYRAGRYSGGHGLASVNRPAMPAKPPVRRLWKVGGVAAVSYVDDVDPALLLRRKPVHMNGLAGGCRRGSRPYPAQACSRRRAMAASALDTIFCRALVGKGIIVAVLSTTCWGRVQRCCGCIKAAGQPVRKNLCRWLVKRRRQSTPKSSAPAGLIWAVRQAIVAAGGCGACGAGHNGRHAGLPVEINRLVARIARHLLIDITWGRNGSDRSAAVFSMIAGLVLAAAWSRQGLSLAANVSGIGQRIHAKIPSVAVTPSGVAACGASAEGSPKRAGGGKMVAKRGHGAGTASRAPLRRIEVRA